MGFADVGHPCLLYGHQPLNPKRLDYGFIGYHVPPVPRAARSARRRRGTFKKKVDDNQMCAFDLLATIAGKILLETDNTSTDSNSSSRKDPRVYLNNTVKNEQQVEEQELKGESYNQETGDRIFGTSDLGPQAPVGDCRLKEIQQSHTDTCSGLASVITNSDCSEKLGYAEKLVIGKTKNDIRSPHCNVDAVSSGCRESCDIKPEDESDSNRMIKTELHKCGNLVVGSGAEMMCSKEDPAVWDSKPSALVSSDMVKMPLCRDHIPCSSIPLCRHVLKLGSRDVDENSSRCNQPSTKIKAFRQPSRIGDRRIRKLLASKYWKVAPKSGDEELSNIDGESKPVYRIRKSCYKRQRSQRNFPFKKRKFSDHSSVSSSDGGISSEGISSSPKKGIIGETSEFGATQHGVKLRIKSFKVPELLIEIPETSTVGSLKRTVLEAVNAILGGGLQVGVLLQGKKIRDDDKTLLQTGISNDNEMDALGFTLEPSPAQSAQPLCPRESPFPICSNTPPPSTRYPATPTLIQGTCNAVPEPPLTNTGTLVESDHDSAPSPTDMSIEKSAADSKALVVVPEMRVEALAVVPVHRKSKRSEIVQRRIRRPFTVAEVEALVQAVEKLGTGRWRDVKLRAFDNAKHRTYVDLKDKWKTLVHTAGISPQQRRGEPVPQELLDRVLTAHAYWSQQQAKQKLKQQQTETCLLLENKI
ncbi:hypothetical protein RJ641_008708 [Dillenia turbinata]|uniref:Uncharacterized protein n=1 Tax=Dillenia turbinata TaxID=194707 RepID=A0AAN8V8M8_9MAGN